MPESPPGLRRFRWSGATARTLGGTVVGLLVGFLVPGELGWLLRCLVGWDAGASALLAAHWVRIAQATPRSTSEFAAADDPGRNEAWIFSIGFSALSLAAAVYALRDEADMTAHQIAVRTGFAVLGVALSWLVTQTTYTLRYAHLFYGSRSQGWGFAFPGTKDPADLDFAYFAFTIGMTFQTSDVGIESPAIRRTVLGHALLSFVFNTIILAVTLNLVLKFLPV